MWGICFSFLLFPSNLVGLGPSVGGGMQIVDSGDMSGGWGRGYLQRNTWKLKTLYLSSAATAPKGFCEDVECPRARKRPVGTVAESTIPRSTHQDGEALPGFHKNHIFPRCFLSCLPDCRLGPTRPSLGFPLPGSSQAVLMRKTSALIPSLSHLPSTPFTLQKGFHCFSSNWIYIGRKMGAL